jgi:hypothetical protein
LNKWLQGALNLLQRAILHYEIFPVLQVFTFLISRVTRSDGQPQGPQASPLISVVHY